MDFVSCLKNIRPNRKAVLFLGAGFSNAARNRLGLDTPSGSQLSERILSRLCIPGSASLSLAVDKLREKLPPNEAHAFLQDQLSAVSLSDDQAHVLSLPWSRIYTTNVDDIGSNFSGRSWHDSTEDRKRLGIGDFVYLHGCISSCNANNYSQKLKLGEQMYMSNALASSGYNHALRKDLFSADVVIVIGYSMADPNYQDIFYNSADLINKCFVVSGNPDELALHRIKMIGTNTNKTIGEMVCDLKTTNFGVGDFLLRSELTRVEKNFAEKEVTQQVRQDMLIYGKYDDNVARSSWAAEEQAYAIKRQIAEQLLTVRVPSIAVIHSHLGNGKHVIISYAKYLLSKDRKGGLCHKVGVKRRRVSGCDKRSTGGFIRLF